MFGGQIPTANANSRLAALAARKRPTIDINRMGIAVEAGGGGTPMLTNRGESLSDAGVARAGGRALVNDALDASARTYRTGLINDALQREREQREMDYALAEEDALAKAKAGNAVSALQARGKAETFFDPMVTKMRQADMAEKMRLYESQTAGTIAKAIADERVGEMRAGADIEAARLGAGSRALSSLAEIRAGLEPETPAKDGWLWDTPAVPNDQAQRDELDARTMALIDSLGLSDDVAEAVPEAAEPAAPSPADQQRTQAIATFSQRHGITPQQAEAILVRRGLIQ